MRAREVIRVCAVFYLICPANIIGLWWAVGSPLITDANAICRKSRKIGGRQREICDKERDVVEAIANGVRLALAECQYQFRDRQWNCTTRHRSFVRILKYDTRETGFLWAITASGGLVAIARECALGRLLECSCHKGEWRWGGCENTFKDYGYVKSKRFIDIRRRGRRNDIKTLVHLHNSEAGRLAVINYMKPVCKCHGLSGSCATKTCWQTMPSFRQIGNHLKDKFDSASKVIGSNDGKSLLPEGVKIKPPAQEDIVYTEQSPNFCVANRRVGSLGTKGRVCDPRSQRTEGCELLCCGRGSRRKTVTIRENCKCRFHWCCEVTCQSCIRHKVVHRCL